jgi:hypothetical protein
MPRPDTVAAVQPNPEFRNRVRALTEGQWGEPVVVVHLADVRPEFTVPGRRKDGTVAGTRLVRRFFWNVLRGTVGGIVSAAMSIAAGARASIFERPGRVRGPANAQALGLVDAALAATAAWLVHSPSHVAVVDTGHTFQDPAQAPPPEIRWHATTPDLPRIEPRRRCITWPDGSVYEYDLSQEEAALQARPG